jgi:hypothetical protein
MNTSSPFKQPKVRISETVDQAVKLEGTQCVQEQFAADSSRRCADGI